MEPAKPVSQAPVPTMVAIRVAARVGLTGVFIA